MKSLNFVDLLKETIGGYSLEHVAKGITLLKGITPDYKMVGIDNVTDGAYFANFISIGTIYKNPSGNFKVIVDAIFYPEHKAESGKCYNDEVRFISYEFDPDTLKLTGKRNNVGYDFLKNKCEIVATNLCDYIVARKAQENMKKVVLELDENTNDDYDDDYYDEID